MQERIDRGDQFIFTTDPSTLPHPKYGYIDRVPNEFFTAKELEYSNSQDGKPKYRPSSTKKSEIKHEEEKKDE